MRKDSVARSVRTVSTRRMTRTATAVVKKLLLCAALAGAAVSAGCATINVQKIPPQEGKFPLELSPDAPLVLAIPGLVIPVLGVTQEQHFGYLVEMLAERGIPCRIIPYDTKENPLSRDAALFSPVLAIAWTRVGPAIVREVEFENERRSSRGLPPVKKLVLFGFSQGGVIVEQIAQRIFYSFRSDYKRITGAFGDEWHALKEDPEFKYYINALDDFLVIKNIKVQQEKEFKRNPDLQRFYERAEAKASNQFNDFVQYVTDPSSRYPGVAHFGGPGSPYYPKRYNKIRLCASDIGYCTLEEKEKIKNFFVDYAEYRELLEVTPYFITASASFFGSPRANEGSTLLKWLPFLNFFVRSELRQITQTKLGAVHQMERFENLFRLNRDESYPLHRANTLFIVGANGSRGDGLVDQSSAHLSSHAFTRVRVSDDPADGVGPEVVIVEHDRLPDLVVVPVRALHFPVKALWGLGGTRYGTAYMEEGNPSFPYLLEFIGDNWKVIDRNLSTGGIKLRQFMLGITFADAETQGLSARLEGQSPNVRIDGHYFNRESRTAIWIGHFAGPGEEMNLCHGKESVEGTVRLDVRLPGGGRAPLTCAVYPGCNCLVVIETGREEGAG